MPRADGLIVLRLRERKFSRNEQAIKITELNVGIVECHMQENWLKRRIIMQIWYLV